jgi:hypothetical protein
MGFVARGQTFTGNVVRVGYWTAVLTSRVDWLPLCKAHAVQTRLDEIGKADSREPAGHYISRW